MLYLYEMHFSEGGSFCENKYPVVNYFRKKPQFTQPAFTYSKLTKETPEQGVKYAQN